MEVWGIKTDLTCVPYNGSEASNYINVIQRTISRTSKSGITDYYKTTISSGGKICIGNCSILYISEEFWYDLGKYGSAPDVFITNELQMELLIAKNKYNHGYDDLCLQTNYLEYLLNDSKSGFKTCYIIIEDANGFKKAIKSCFNDTDDFTNIIGLIAFLNTLKSYSSFKFFLISEQIKSIKASGSRLKKYFDNVVTPLYLESLRYNGRIHADVGLNELYQEIKSMI